MPRVEVYKVKQLAKADLAKLGDKPLAIGRSSQNDLVLRDINVSRRHCVIEQIDGQRQIRDLESHAGTFLNGERVQSAPIAEGDVICVGPFEIVYGHRNGAAPQAPQREEVSPLAIAELEDWRKQLEERQAQAEARDAELEQKAAELAGREVMVEDRETHAIRELQQQLEERQAELEERNSEVLRLTEVLADVRKQLQARNEELEAAHGEHAALRDAAEEAAREAAAARQRTAGLDSYVNRLMDGIQEVHEIAQQVTALQTRFELVEAAWVELEERLEDAGDDESLAEQAALQRQAISTQLSELADERDRMVAALYQAASRLREVASRHRPADEPAPPQIVSRLSAPNSRVAARR